MLGARDDREAAAQFGLDAVSCPPLAPLPLGLERDEELRVVRPLRLRGVLGPPDMRHHVEDLGRLQDRLPHDRHLAPGFVEGDGRGEDRRHVNSPFVELGKKLGADPRRVPAERHAPGGDRRQHEPADGVAALQQFQVGPPDSHQPRRLGRAEPAPEKEPLERGHDDHRRDECSPQGERIGVGHRGEDPALHPLQEEDRNKRDDDDRHGEHHRPQTTSRTSDTPSTRLRPTVASVARMSVVRS